ncbi:MULTISPECIES: hypothetical protein [Sporosarcina]|uniref:hypothetical protein n=1 Tax=Sporosarcina TaxID=1569 RepID=UPI00129B131F|nr:MULTISPECIES: hypothetical protein [Sporosarcina]GKV64441.1 hypothetical protein NCCP2331_05940 [Sporosarcina sp. NCCP-2331]GLB55186.1 hypothetical protein NCCP2378_09720 [Sporosarcina sp. NCCP-2378]
MLTFEEKQQIIEGFPELVKKEVSMKRLNYHYEESLFDKTVVVQHLHPNGNGFVYVADVKGYEPDERGLVNIREFTAEELRTVIKAAVEALATEPAEAEPLSETWQHPNGSTLTVLEEDSFFNVYHGVNLEEGFGDYGEAVSYLKEEGFSLKTK